MSYWDSLKAAGATGAAPVSGWTARRRSTPNNDVLQTISSYMQDGAAPVKRASDMAANIGTTPSADPELWQAIFNSLEQQNQCQERQLARHLSDASPELAGRLRQQRSEQRRVSAEGVTYFACTDGSGSDSSSQELSSAGGGLVLPSFAGHPPAVRAAVVGQLCNGYLQSQAEEEGVINAIPGCTPLLVLTTLGDGNCACHACSLGVWGVHDRDAQLRGAIEATMLHPQAGAAVRARFFRQLARNGLPQEEWEKEWQLELRSLQGSTYLSDVHVYTLASVLRRPIVVYADQAAAAAGLAGVYLPSLWPAGASLHCARQPLALLFGYSHFSLLATVEGEGPASPPLLPLATRAGPLQLRFLSEQEEQRLSGGGGGGELGLLRQYMDAERLFLGSLGVRLTDAPRPHVLAELLGSAYVKQAAEAQQAAEVRQPQQEQARQAQH